MHKMSESACAEVRSNISLYASLSSVHTYANFLAFRIASSVLYDVLKTHLYRENVVHSMQFMCINVDVACVANVVSCFCSLHKPLTPSTSHALAISLHRLLAVRIQYPVCVRALLMHVGCFVAYAVEMPFSRNKNQTDYCPKNFSKYNVKTQC